MPIQCIIIGNIISGIGILIDTVMSIKANSKAKILYGNVASSACSVLSYLVLGATEGVITGVVSMSRMIVTLLKDKYKKKWYPVMLLYIGFYALSFTQGINIKTVIIFISSLIVFIPKWVSQNPQVIRMTTFISQTMMLPYCFMVQNYFSFVSILVSDVGLLIGFLRFLKKNKEL